MKTVNIPDDYIVDWSLPRNYRVVRRKNIHDYPTEHLEAFVEKDDTEHKLEWWLEWVNSNK